MSYSRCRATDPRPSLMGYQARVSAVRRQVRGAMEIALFIQNIQVSAALLLVTCLRSVTCPGGEGGGGALHLHQPNGQQQHHSVEQTYRRNRLELKQQKKFL